MRIIAGTARSLPLKTVEGLDTRPTTDRIKETLFNIIQDEIPGCYFLDLFAGSGQMGLEAVSRGAQYAVFVENNKKAAACVEDNIRFTVMNTPARNNNTTTPVQPSGCFKCGELGHYANNCPKRNPQTPQRNINQRVDQKTLARGTE